MPIIIPANSAAGGGYEVENSLRFNSGSSDYLQKNTATATDAKKFTYSGWLKRTGGIASSSTGDRFYIGYLDGNNRFYLTFAGGDTIFMFGKTGGTEQLNWETTRKFRDPSAWYHIVVSADSTQNNQDDRIKLYVNGVQETFFTKGTSPGQNFSWGNQLAQSNNTLRLSGGEAGSNFFNGLMSEVVFIDGTALDPTSFGEFDEDSGIWKPISISGLTFGNNGFYLEFGNSGALGTDSSGEGNTFGVVNLAAIDQTTDTCTNNFATFISIDMSRWQNITPLAALSNGALQTVIGSSEKVLLRSTIGVKTGKWYWEAKSDGVSKMYFGVVNLQSGTDANPPADSSTYTGVWYYEGAGSPEFKYYSGASTTSGTVAISSGDILNFALDCDNQTFYIGKNGTYMNSGNPTSGGTGTGAINRKFNYASALFAVNGAPTEMFASCYVSSTSGTGTAQYNFGNPTFTGTDKSDGNDKGSFEYQPPTGYLALCTANLSETNS